MAWFSCMMHISQAWTSFSSDGSISSVAMSPGTCCHQNLHSLFICFPLGWLDQGCTHMVHSGSKLDVWEPCLTEWPIWTLWEAGGPGWAGHTKSSMAWSPEIANRSTKRLGTRLAVAKVLA